MGRPQAFAPTAALEGLGLPHEGQVWKWCNCLGHRGSGSTRCSGGWWLGQQEILSLEGYGNQSWPICSSIPAWRTRSLREKPGRPLSTGSQRGEHDWSNPKCIDVRLFCLWKLCPSEGWAWRQSCCLACGDPGGAQCAGTRTASAAGAVARSESFFEPLVAGDQKACLAGLSP